MRARLYTFVGPVGVSVPVGRRHARRTPRGVFHPSIRTLTDVLVRWRWFALVLWIDVLGFVILATQAPISLVVTVPVALWLGVSMRHAARIRRARR